jgi:hypothetical protein
MYLVDLLISGGAAIEWRQDDGSRESCMNLRDLEHTAFPPLLCRSSFQPFRALPHSHIFTNIFLRTKNVSYYCSLERTGSAG